MQDLTTRKLPTFGCVIVYPYQKVCPSCWNLQEASSLLSSLLLFSFCVTPASMAAFAMKVVDKTKEKMDDVAYSTKQAVLETKKHAIQTAIETKQHVDEALVIVRGQTWSEPLGKACAVTGGIVSGLGNFVPGLGIVGGALSLGSKVLNPTASMNDVRREQETGCIFCS